MTITTLSSQDFARDLTKAQQATDSGPVVVTDAGKPAYALLSFDDYYRLTSSQPKSLLDVMDQLPGGDFDFDPLPLGSLGIHAAELE